MIPSGVVVSNSVDLKRIKNLPLRQWSGEGEIRDLMHKYLRIPGSTMELRPVQVAALQELHDFGGLFGIIRVGAGKSLIALLAPVVLQAQRPLLLIPASRRQPTIDDARVYAQHFYVARNLTILNYELFSRDTHAEFLYRHKPDLIIADECHALKATNRPRAKRITRYMQDFRDQCVFLGMSGSIMKRSIKDYWHLVKWAFPRNAPLPYDLGTMLEWSEAIDRNVLMRKSPGPLIDLHPRAEGKTLLEKARSAYALRLTETPGVISTGDDQIQTGLLVRQVEPKINREVFEPALRCLRDRWETPDGHPFEMAIDLWRHVRELVCGFYYVWDPRPPMDWLEARREWSQLCRYILKTNRRNLDTDAQVARAIDRGHYGTTAEKTLRQWREVKPSFKENNVARWVDYSVVDYATKWLQKEKGICWVEHTDFGNLLSERSGVPYFARLGADKSGKHIEKHRGPAIASVASLHKGANLQKWHKNLMISHPPVGYIWEQTIGRTHRDGQLSDEVIFDVPIICLEQWLAMCKAISDAEGIQETTLQNQKLVYAEKIIIDENEVVKRASNDYLWQQ